MLGLQTITSFFFFMQVNIRENNYNFAFLPVPGPNYLPAQRPRRLRTVLGLGVSPSVRAPAENPNALPALWHCEDSLIHCVTQTCPRIHTLHCRTMYNHKLGFCSEEIIVFNIILTSWWELMLSKSTVFFAAAPHWIALAVALQEKMLTLEKYSVINLIPTGLKKAKKNKNCMCGCTLTIAL